MEIRKGVTVEIVRLNHLPSKILRRDLGTRMLNARGFVETSVAGFDSDAWRVSHCDPFGELNGGWGIYFPGEYRIIPDLLN